MHSDIKHPGRPGAVWAALITVYIAWGSTFLAIRYVVETMPPFLTASVRFLIAGGILYAWRRISGDAPPTRRQWRSAAVVGLFLLLGGNGCVSWAEQRLTSSVTALLIASVPVWMVLLDALLHGRQPGYQKPGRLTLLGILVGFAGIVLLVSPNQQEGAQGKIDLLGAAAVTLGAFLWAAGSLYSRSADLPDSALLGTSMEMLCGGLGLLLAGTVTGEWASINIPAISANSLLGLVYLIIFGSWVGFAAYTWLLRAAPIPLVSTYAYINPVVAVVMGHLIAAEPLTIRMELAAAVIIGAVALITVTQPPPAIAKENTVPLLEE